MDTNDDASVNDDDDVIADDDVSGDSDVIADDDDDDDSGDVPICEIVSGYSINLVVAPGINRQ